MKNTKNPYSRPGYSQALNDSTREFYSSWANRNAKKKRRNSPLSADPAAKEKVEKKGTASKVLLGILLGVCILSVLALNFLLPPEMKGQILDTIKSFIHIPL